MKTNTLLALLLALFIYEQSWGAQATDPAQDEETTVKPSTISRSVEVSGVAKSTAVDEEAELREVLTAVQGLPSRKKIADVFNEIKQGKLDFNMNIDFTNSLFLASFNVPEVAAKKALVQACLNSGAVGNPRARGATGLHLAAGTGDEDLLRMVLDHQFSNLNVGSDHVLTPIYFAILNCRIENVRILIRAGAIIDSRTFNGMTALEYVEWLLRTRYWDQPKYIEKFQQIMQLLIKPLTEKL